MEFELFLKHIPKIVKEPLPGVNAHLKMAPPERVASLNPQNYQANSPRQSAVMMLIYPKNSKANIVLTKRNTYVGVHSSQISFPGGRYEPRDKNMETTALRETFEEIGIPQESIEIVKPFSQIYIPPSNFIVHPFLGISGMPLQFNPSPYEVNAVIELPLDTFMDDSIVLNADMHTSYSQNTSVPAFIFEDNIVWGATAMILSELKETLKNVFK